MNKTGIKKAKKRILDFFSDVDKSGKNTELYKEKFKNMTDREFVNMIKQGLLKLYIKPFDIEPTLEDAKRACDHVGLPSEEEITLPFLYDDEELGAAISNEKVMILEIPFKRLQQMIYKENSSSSDMTTRDKTNQAIKDSKSAKISDQEVSVLDYKGFEKTLEEFLTFRADHTISKNEAYDNIVKSGKTNIPDSIKDPDSKVAVNYLHALFLAMGISTDLIEDLDQL